MRNLLVLTLLVFSGAARASENPPAGWGELFSDAPAGGAIEKVLAALDNDPARVAAAIAADEAYEALQPGWIRRADKVADGATEYEMVFHVRVPRGYTPEKSWPVLLAAHGQDGNGPHIGRMMAWALGKDVEGFIMVAPTLPGPQNFNGRAYQEQSYLKALAWTRRNLNVDDDRIAISGYSMGGHCAWHMATMFPHLLAAAVPMAGVPTFEGSPYTSLSYLPNLRNLPVRAIWGELDRAGAGSLGNVDFARSAAAEMTKLGHDKFTGEERPGAGHKGCFPRPGTMGPYLAAHARRVMPEKITHFFHLPSHARGYYVEAVKLSRPPEDFSKVPKVRLAPGRTSPADVIAAGRAHYEKSLFKVWAELDRSGNALTIRAQGVTTVRITVMEGMFDLSKPVTLRFDRRSWTGPVAPSARCMLTHYAATRDATGVVVNEVDLDALGRAAVRFGAAAGGARQDAADRSDPPRRILMPVQP